VPFLAKVEKAKSGTGHSACVKMKKKTENGNSKRCDDIMTAYIRSRRFLVITVDSGKVSSGDIEG
jgi:hypothetical protein